MPDATTWVPIRSFAAVYEADFAVAILEGAGIPTRTRAETVGIFGPGYAGASPKGVAVLVPADRVDDARDVLDDA